MSAAADTLSVDERATIAFMTGVGAGGTLFVQDSGWAWDAGTAGAPVYGPTGWAHKWGGGGAGTPATVTYAIDPSSGFSAGEQGIIASALALWSAETGIAFVPAAARAPGDVTFFRYGSPDDPGTAPGVYTEYSAPPGSAGSASIPATLTSFVSLDTSQPSWSELASFTAFGGYGVDTLVHEIGHVLGLFHAGPYNGAVDPLTQQFNSTDSRQWTLMSYIDPLFAATFSADYVYPKSNWGASPDGYAREPTTPMPLDILAAQRLYGLPADTPLSGGQVFGFHCNIEGAIRPFFDFTGNTAPVVTLWDEGTGNALDLSGFAGASAVDLRPGTFSSADGMTDNIGIAYGTRIDSLVGSQGGATVTLNADSDTVRGVGGGNAAVLAAANGLYPVGGSGAGTATVRMTTGVVDVLVGVQGLGFSGGGATVVVARTDPGFGLFDLSGGHNVLFLGDQAATVRSAGTDTVVAGAGGATVADTGSVGSLIFGTTGALAVAGGGGTDTIVSGAAGAAVRGGAGGAFVWAAGPVVYVGGTGAATVAADAATCVTVRAGGGGLFVGGGAGNNVLGANGGAATLIGGGGGDQLVAQNAAANVLVAGAGAETLYAVGATGRNTFFAGADSVAMTGGSGENVFVAGSGEATVTAGAGEAVLTAIAGHAGGEVAVIGWDPAQDKVELWGYGSGAVAAAVEGAQVDPGGSTVITLSDHTRILFADVTGISRGWFV